MEKYYPVSYCHILLVTFPSHFKKLHSKLRFWLEKLNCGFFFTHFTREKTPQNNFFFCQNFSVENNKYFSTQIDYPVPWPIFLQIIFEHFWKQRSLCFCTYYFWIRSNHKYVTKSCPVSPCNTKLKKIRENGIPNYFLLLWGMFWRKMFICVFLRVKRVKKNENHKNVLHFKSPFNLRRFTIVKYCPNDSHILTT